MSAPYALGYLTGNQWYQYANRAGQVYYNHVITGQETLTIPAGFEDLPADTWARDTSKGFELWINQRTGRVLLDDPKPPPPESYLDMPIIKLGLDKLAAVPELPENLYQRPIGAILNWTFPVLEGFSAARGGWNSLTIPDFTFTKVEQVPKGRAKNWEVLLVESKALGHPWGSAYDQLVNAWEVNTNDSKNVYGMIHIGMDIKFYKFESGQVQELTGKLHLINDAKEITDRLVWIKQNPLSFDE